jgi:hypothetical protein
MGTFSLPGDFPKILKIDQRKLREVLGGSVDASMMWIAKEISKSLEQTASFHQQSTCPPFPS